MTFHHMKSKALFERDLVPNNIGVYFYDGDHSYEATRLNIEWAESKLADTAVLLIDDYNDSEIRRATEDALANMSFDITWHEFLPGDATNQGRMVETVSVCFH